jgi:predicted transposase/invertase (TIGR01784 family)
MRSGLLAKKCPETKDAYKFIKELSEDEKTRLREIEEAHAVLKKFSEDEAMSLLHESREKAIWDEQARLYGATQKAKKEIAKNFLADGISPEIVAKNTGLSLEDVRSL